MSQAAADARYVSQSDSPIDVKGAPYSAKGDGVTDDTTAIQAAIAALPASGGTLSFPPGTYNIATSLNVASTTSVRFVGAGGASAGATTATVLKFSGTPTRAIDARSSYGFCLLDVSVIYTNAAMTGALIDFSHVTSTDASFMSIERCFLGGSQTGASSLLLLDKANSGSFRDVIFNHAATGVAGAASGASYSNGHTFSGCQWFGLTASSTSSTGEGWSFTGCVFEQLVSGPPGTIVLGTSIGKGISISGCWFGDNTLAGTIIDLGNATGASITGNYFGVLNGINVSCISVDNGAGGIWIAGNYFDGPSTGSNCLFFTGTSTNTVYSCYLLGNGFNFGSGGHSTNANPKMGIIDAGGQALSINGIVDVVGAGTGNTGNGLRVSEVANGKQGVATLAAGTVVVSNTSVTASSRILLTSNTDGGTPGWLRVSARSVGTSFTITSSSATDTSVVAYQIFEPG